MANFTQNMIWTQNIFPDGLICIFCGLMLLKHLGRMMFVHPTWEMLSPGRGGVFLNRISWLVQVDQEELHRLRGALEMGQNRAVHKTSLRHGSEETDTALVSTKLFHSLGIPFQKKKLLWPKCCDRSLFPPATISDELQEHQSPAQNLFIFSWVWLCPCSAHPKGCSPLPCQVQEL